MLLSAVVAVSPEQDALLPPSLGRAAHALLLRLVREADAGLAAELHAEAPARPFTAAFLEEGAAAGQRLTVCRTGRRYHLRFTSLEARLSELLLEQVRSRLPERVDLDGSAFRVGGVTTEAAEHPWAGRSSYRALAERWLLGAAPPPRVGLAFHSPTTFHSQGRHVPLPLPELVFGSLLERWNAFAPLRLDEVRGYAAEALAVSRYRLATRLVAVGGGKQVGFVGECEYTALRADPYGLRQAHLLADFGFYAGVGHKTTMGLGRARRSGDGGAVRG